MRLICCPSESAGVTIINFLQWPMIIFLWLMSAWASYQIRIIAGCAWKGIYCLNHGKSMYIFHGTYCISQCHYKQVNTWDWVLAKIIRFSWWAQLARTLFRYRFYVSWAHIISYFLDEFKIHSFQCKIGLIYVISRSSHRGREKGRSFAGDILKFT